MSAPSILAAMCGSPSRMPAHASGSPAAPSSTNTSRIRISESSSNCLPTEGRPTARVRRRAPPPRARAEGEDDADRDEMAVRHDTLETVRQPAATRELHHRQHGDENDNQCRPGRSPGGGGFPPHFESVEREAGGSEHPVTSARRHVHFRRQGGSTGSEFVVGTTGTANAFHYDHVASPARMICGVSCPPDPHGRQSA